jgi:hypothetical protein
MEIFDKVWEYFTKLPRLLADYSAYSYPLLIVLLVGGVVVLAVHIVRRLRSREGLAATYLVFAGMLVFLSVGGGFLKWMGERQKAADEEASRERQQERQRAFVSQHRAPQGQHWLLVFDFTVPPTLDAQQQKQLLHRMELLVATLSEVLSESLPPEFRQPRIVRVPTADSPWPEGISQQNFDRVIGELNGFEIMWGNVLERGTSAKAFLGLPGQLMPRDLDAIIPLEEVALDQDPRREQQFGDGYYRLLGLVTLGIALDTYHRAQQAQGDQRKHLFLKAADQLSKARQIVSNARDDNVLKRTVYNTQVTDMIQVALREAEALP